MIRSGRRRTRFTSGAVALLAAIIGLASCGDDGGAPGSDARPATADAAVDLRQDPLDGRGTEPAPAEAAVDSAPDAGAEAIAVDAPAIDAPAVEAGTMEALPGVACTTHADCPMTMAPGFGHCVGDHRSCLRGTPTGSGRCVRECSGPARTCGLDAQGCVACQGSSDVTCPAAPCMVRDRRLEVESTSCTPNMIPSFERSQCHGRWLIRSDGSLCSVRELATGAVRHAVACPECTTIFVQHN